MPTTAAAALMPEVSVDDCGAEFGVNAEIHLESRFRLRCRRNRPHGIAQRLEAPERSIPSRSTNPKREKTASAACARPVKCTAPPLNPGGAFG